jgi:crossover junction endodeoxyribonuclease RusA
VTVTLPYPPTTNHAYLVARGRKVKTQVARDYAHEVMWRVADEMRVDPDGEWPTKNDRVAVAIVVTPPDRRRRDLGNVEKLAIDAICAQLGIDDSQIDLLTLVRAEVDRQNPRLVITLEALP